MQPGTKTKPGGADLLHPVSASGLKSGEICCVIQFVNTGGKKAIVQHAPEITEYEFKMRLK